MKPLHILCTVLSLSPLLACGSSSDSTPSDTGGGSASADTDGSTSAGMTTTGSTQATATTATPTGGATTATAVQTSSTSTTGTLTAGSGGTATTSTSQASSTNAGGAATGTGPFGGMTMTASGTRTAGSTTGSTTVSTSTSTTGGMAECESGPLDLPLPDCSPLPVPDTGDFHADCVARINQFRWECQCLPPLDRWVEGEDCADQMAEYDAMLDEAHAGIRAKICEPSNAGQNECLNYGPSFGIIDFCFQQMWDEGPGEDFQVHGHYLNMSDPDSNRVACGVYVAPNGDVTSVQNFQ